VARRRGTAGLGKVDAFYGFYDVEEQRDSPSANEMMVKYGTDNKASMAGKGKALILGRVTDSLWVEVLRWAGLESWSQVEGMARIAGYSKRMEAGCVSPWRQRLGVGLQAELHDGGMIVPSRPQGISAMAALGWEGRQRGWRSPAVAGWRDMARRATARDFIDGVTRVREVGSVQETVAILGGRVMRKHDGHPGAQNWEALQRHG
jgi:hypothetical protein